MAEVTSPDLSVIVVTWNVRELTLRCLDALRRRADDDGIRCEIILVDNASADGTPDAVRAAHPDAVVVANRVNVGFPIANNQGLTRARGRHVLFLNPDTEVGPGTLRACLDELESQPDVGMVGCRLEYPDGSTQLEGARRAYRLRHLVTESFYLHMLFPRSRVFAHQLMGDWDHAGRRDVEAILGAFMLVPREVALAVGGLPDEVFMYHEDLAFCLRIRSRGWRIRYVGDVSTVHHVNQSSRKSQAHLGLLEGEYKLRLIREGQGRLAASAGRVVLGMRAATRTMMAGVAGLLPGLEAARERHPRLFDARRHWLQLLWSISPTLVAEHVPRPPSPIPPDARIEPRTDIGIPPRATSSAPGFSRPDATPAARPGSAATPGRP